MDRNETIQVDATTGGKKAGKLARFDLIPPEPLIALAEHFGRGAQKYTSYGECTCVNIIDRYMHSVIVDRVTKNRFVNVIQNLQNANVKMHVNGLLKILKLSENEEESTVKEKEIPLDTYIQEGEEHISYLQQNMTVLSKTPVDFVDELINHGILTTITLQSELGEPFVMDVTSVLDSLRNVGPNGFTKHLNGCMSQKVLVEGARNWELGYDWGKSFAAMQRHAWLFWNGEDIDPETGSHHLTAVAWHAFAMLEWFRTHPELDDRSKL